MKITAKKYAQALFESTEGKSKNESEKIISRFVNILVENKDLKKAEKVINCFGKIWNENHAIAAVDVVTAEEADDNLVRSLNVYVAKMFKAKNVEISRKVDKSIIGGIIIRHHDTIYDGSLKSRLYSLKEKLIK